MSGSELYYLDEDGKKQDASLHAEILDNAEADTLAQRQSYASAIAQGVTQATAKALYPLGAPQ